MRVPGAGLDRAPLAAESYDLFRLLLRHQLEQRMTICHEIVASTDQLLHEACSFPAAFLRTSS